MVPNLSIYINIIWPSRLIRALYPIAIPSRPQWSWNKSTKALRCSPQFQTWTSNPRTSTAKRLFLKCLISCMTRRRSKYGLPRRWSLARHPSKTRTNRHKIRLVRLLKPCLIVLKIPEWHKMSWCKCSLGSTMTLMMIFSCPKTT